MNACLRETLAHFTVGISTLSTMESLYLSLTQKSKGNEGTSYADIPGRGNKEQMLVYLPTTT